MNYWTGMRSHLNGVAWQPRLLQNLFIPPQQKTEGVHSLSVFIVFYSILIPAAHAVSPPSTLQHAPVTKDAFGDARKYATAAISSAVPMRPAG